jgi:hypothetical protein
MHFNDLLKIEFKSVGVKIFIKNKEIINKKLKSVIFKIV